METTRKYYRVDRREISFLRFILEGYSGLAVCRTLDPAAGLVALHVAPGSEPEVEALMESLKADFRIETWADPETVPVPPLEG